MKRFLPVLFTLALAVTAAFSIPKPDPTTVNGTLIDTKCYGMDHDNMGNDHNGGKLKSCATACATMGIPVGLLKDGKKDGDVLILVAPATALAEYMGKDARVTYENEAYPGGIIPSKVEVKVDGEWKDVTPAGMM